MSVPADKRTPGKLQVCVEAHSLACYTLMICKNKKVFKEEYQDVLTNKIIEAGLLIHENVWSANNVVVNSHDDYVERRMMQERAAVKCNTLLSDIQIAWTIFHLASKRVKFWGEKIIKTRNLIRAWRDSDDKRYAKFRGRL